MSFDSASYLGILIAIIALSLGIIVSRRPGLFRLVSSFLLTKSIYRVVIIICFVLISVVISFALNINESISSAARQRIVESNGSNTGVIFNYDQTKLYSQEEINAIFSNVSDDFDSYLPILIKETKIVDKNVLLINFDLKTGRNYSSTFAKLDEGIFNLSNDSEAVISEEVASKLSLKENDKFKVGTREFIVKKIIPDNELVGYDFPIEAKLNNPVGSIFISENAIQTIDRNSSENIETSISNAILVKRKNTYSRENLSQKVNQLLKRFNNDLVFEETLVYTTNKEFGSADGLNIGQLILIYGGIILIPIILLIFTMTEKLRKDRFQTLNRIRIIGFSQTDITMVLILEKSIYALFAGIVGTLIGLGISYLTLRNGLSSVLDNSVNAVFSPQVFLISFAASWVFTVLIAGILSINYGLFNVTISRKYFEKQFTPFRFKEHTIKYLLIFAGFIILYYSFGGYIPDENLTTFAKYTGFDVMIVSLFFLTKTVWPSRSKLVLNLVAIYLLLISLWNVGGDIYKTIPLLQIYDAIKMLISGLILVNLDTSLFSNLITFVLGKIAAVKIYSRLAFEFFESNFGSTFFYSLIFSLLFSVLAFLPVVNKTADLLSKSAVSEYDILIIDKLGREDINSELDSVKDSTSRVEKIHFGTIKLPEFKIKDLKGYSGTNTSEEVFPDNISTINSDFQDKYLIKSEENFQTKLNSFSENNYILLGPNYINESNENSLHPEIKIGDTIEIEFQNGTKVKREVVGFVENQKESQTQTTSLNGIYLSEKDYAELNSTSKINLSTAYALKLNDSSSANSVLEKLSVSLKDKYLSQLSLTRNTLTETFSFFNKIIELLLYSVLLVLLMLTIVYCYSLKQKLNFEVLSSRYNTLSSQILMLFTLIISAALGYFFVDYLWNNFRKLAFEDIGKFNVNLDSREFAIYVSAILISSFILSSLMFFINKYEQKKN